MSSISVIFIVSILIENLICFENEPSKSEPIIELKIEHSYQGFLSEYIEQLARTKNLDDIKYNITLDCIVENTVLNPLVMI